MVSVRNCSSGILLRMSCIVIIGVNCLHAQSTTAVDTAWSTADRATLSPENMIFGAVFRPLMDSLYEEFLVFAEDLTTYCGDQWGAVVIISFSRVSLDQLQAAAIMASVSLAHRSVGDSCKNANSEAFAAYWANQYCNQSKEFCDDIPGPISELEGTACVGAAREWLSRIRAAIKQVDAVIAKL